MARIVELNKAAEPAPAGNVLALSAGDVRRLRAAGAFVLDVRSPEEFAAGHLPGALSVQIEGAQFPNRAGLTLPAEADVVLVAATEAQAHAAITALSVIGHGRVLGFLSGGMSGWGQAGYPVEALPLLSVDALRERLSATDDLLILDVREPGE